MKNFEEIYEELKNTNKDELNLAYDELNYTNKRAKELSNAICILEHVILFITLLVFAIINKNIKILSLEVPFGLFTLLVFNKITHLYMLKRVGADDKYSKYNNIYKNQIMSVLISNFYNNLKYFPDRKMPRFIYQIPGYEMFDIYNSDDYFEALIDNSYNIQMAEVETQKIVKERDSEGHVETRYVTQFHGLFCKINLNKSINSMLRITPNKKLTYNRHKLDMDSSEFESYFDVSASNQIIAMQLLTSDVMSDLVDFKARTNIKYDIYIMNDIMYIRFHTGEMFEAKFIDEDSIGRYDLEKYYFILQFTYTLSKKFINLINETKI